MTGVAAVLEEVGVDVDVDEGVGVAVDGVDALEAEGAATRFVGWK